jgi:hypothetical protein
LAGLIADTASVREGQAGDVATNLSPPTDRQEGSIKTKVNHAHRKGTADGSVTKMVKVGLFERAEGAKGRLRASIECPRYQPMELGLAAEQAADPSAYWIRYQCEKGK